MQRWGEREWGMKDKGDERGYIWQEATIRDNKNNICEGPERKDCWKCVWWLGARGKAQ